MDRTTRLALVLAGLMFHAAWAAPGEPERPQTFVYRTIAGVDSSLVSLDLSQPDAAGTRPAPILILACGSAAPRGVSEFASRHGYLLADVRCRPSEATDDLAHALAWLHAHVESKGGDRTRQHLIGRGSGALPAGLVAADPQWLAAVDHSPAIVRSTILIDPDAALVAHVAPNRGTPPALIVQTARDSNDTARRVAEAYREAGIRADLIAVTSAAPGAMLLNDFIASVERADQTLGTNWDVSGSQPVPAAPRVPAAPATDADPFSSTALMDDVRGYFHLGEHRTGTPVDDATRAWLGQRLRTAGIDTFEHEWQIAQFFPSETRVAAGNVEIDAWPVWTPQAEDIRGTWVRIARAADAAKARGHIALVEATLNDRAALGPIDQALIDAGAIGAIYLTGRGGTGDYYAENVLRRFVGEVRPMPAVLIGTRDLTRLEPEMTRTGRVSLTIRGTFDRAARSANVVGTIDRGTPWIVVSTPSSGWFRAAGERGAGIALWLALAHWAAQQTTGASYLFVANSGHEFDFLGGRLLHADGHLPPPERTLVWLHLGASIATPAWQRTGAGFVPDDYISRGNLLASDPELMPMLHESFAPIDALAPAPYRPIGELRDVVEHGYRAFGLVGGGNIWSHAHADTPRSVSPQALADVATALTAALQRIEVAANLR